MKAILVSVDYADILALTLPYNRHHFEEVMVVTALRDEATIEVARKNHCRLTVTNSFYDDGAVFNKWKALEQGLDVLGREGWLCVMDADVLWPKEIDYLPWWDTLLPGMLCTPRRRMWDNWPKYPQFCVHELGWDGPIPTEDTWGQFSLHPQQREFAGYSQIFHASDPVLGPPPWHEIDWTHAGGADSFFQEKWPEDKKIRPPFEVLHLGPAGKNWFGRATPLADGTVPEGATVRQSWSGRRIWENRRRNVAEGRDRFHGEKVGDGAV